MKTKFLLFSLILSLLSITNVWADNVDELTASMFAATNTTYTDFSGVEGPNSDAVYAGNNGKTAKGGIQLRSKNNNSGIVSTTSGGVVKTVKITVESGTNTVDVYGSNTAYTAATDLYNNTKQGTKVGSLSATGTITFTDEYAYVGIRSNNGAIYLSSVEITWTSGAAPTYTITPESNNESYGTVSLEGSVITASPKSGYRYANPAYTVSPANSATVSQNENAFTVTPTANTTITINFEPIPQYTVTWNVHGETSTSQVYENEKPVFLDTPASCDATSTTFIGWATAPWTGKIANLDGKTVYTSASAMPNVTDNGTIYYAVFAKGAGESGWSETAITDLGASDIFVIVGDNGRTYAMTNDNGTGSAPEASAVTIANSKITSNVADNMKWNISGNSTDGYTFYPNGNSESWLYCTNTNNGVRVGTNDNKTFAIDGGYLKHSGTSRYVGIYNSQDWRCYTSNGGNIANQTFKFYKYSAGSASEYMTTCAAPTCEDLGTPVVSATEITYNSAKLTWEAVANADKYLVKFNGVDQEPTSNTYFNATGLTASTQYTYQVKALAADAQDDYCDGAFSAEANFTTEAAPTAHLTLIDIEGTHASSGDYAVGTPFNLPTTAAKCAKAFYGWTATENYSSADVAPEYAAGDEFTFLNTTGVTLYAVYADGGATEETATVSIASYATANSWANGTKYTSITLDENVTATASSGTNTGKYYTTGNEWRYYQNESATITIATTVGELSSVKFAYGISNTGILEDADNNVVESATAVSASGTSAVYYVANSGTASNGQVKFTAIEVKYLKPGSYSNYSTTCAAAAEATPNPDNLNNIAATGANGTIAMTYKNVNKSGVTVALYNDAACTETYTGEWLTVSLDNDKNIDYTITENTSYNDARAAYIKLTAPETTGAVDQAVVIIPVSQATKPAVFASLQDLIAADVNANTNVTVTLTNLLIKEIYYYPNTESENNRKGVVFNVQKDNADVKIYFSNSAVPTEWVAGGKVSGTLTDCPWKTYNNTWQLSPASGWTWNQLAYTAPAAIASIEIRGDATQKTYIDGQVFNPAGLSVIAIYDDNITEEDVTTYATWTYNPAKLSESDTEVTVTATYNEKSDDETVTGLTVNPIPNKTIAQFIAEQGGRCYLEGTVSDIETTQQGTPKVAGYFNLTDETGTIYIYKCLNQDGEENKFDKLGVENGDKIKVIAEEYEYYESTTHEAKRVVYVSKAAVSVIGVTLPATASVKMGKTITLTPTIVPSNASNKNVTWSVTSGSDYASVSEEGVVTGLATGEAVIQVTTEDGGYTASCTVTVTEGLPDFTDPNHEWIKITNASKLVAGRYYVIGESKKGMTATNSLTSGYLGNVESTISDGIIASNALGTNTAIFELGGTTDSWTLYEVIGDNTGYLNGTTTSNLSWSNNAATSPIAFDENGNVIIGEANGYRILYNNSSPRFKPYTGQQSMNIPQLYMWAELSHSVTFDANGGVAESVPGVERTDEGKIIIPATEPTHEDISKVFMGWYQISDPSTLYNAGEEFATDVDVTLYAKWSTVPTYTVTYVLGGSGTAPAVTSYPSGKKVTIATIDDLNNPGYLFSGWTVEDAEHNVLPVDDNGQFTMPNSNVKVIAKWARATNDKWVLVTDVTNLKTDGTKYLIASAEAMTDGKYYAMAEQKTNNRAAVEVMHSEDVIRGSSVLAAFVLEDAGDNMFAIKTSNGYLYAASSSKNYLLSQTENNDNGKWTITIEEGVASIVATNSENRNVMQFNYASNNQLFSCYKEATYKSLAIYEKAPNRVIEDETVNASDLTAGTDVTIKDGGTLTVDADKQIGDLTVEEGGVVALNNTLTVVGTFTIETTMAGGKSGQLKGATQSNFIAQADAYIDITLGAGATSSQWHAFTVPFPVDALNGIFDLDGNKLTNEQNYAIMDYHGDIRAQGKYGWKKFRGTLVPGTFYLMTVDGERTTYRMKMKAGSNVVAGNSKYVYEYAVSGEGQSTDAGWNGIGNPTLAYGTVNVNVQVLDPESYTYIKKDPNTNFIVGTPFFYQAAISDEITIMGEDNKKPYYAPARIEAKATEDIKLSFGNEDFTDYLDISASEDATNNYQIGKDLVKLTMTDAPKVAQIFGAAYNTKLCMVHTPLINDVATCDLSLYAPANGTYTLSVDDTAEEVFLAFDGQIIWNLTAAPFTLDMEKGNNNHYSLIVVSHNTPTDIEGANGSEELHSTRKVLYDGHMFIIREGRVFDVTGKTAK